MVTEASRNGLLDLLRPALSEELIRKMAAYDVGYDAEINYRELLRIRDTSVVPGKLDFCPAEVCNLAVIEPDLPNIGDLSEERRSELLISLFAAWILVAAYVQPSSLESGMVEQGDEITLKGLVTSAISLGHKYVREALAFVIWAAHALAADHPQRKSELPFYTFSQFILLANTLQNDDLDMLKKSGNLLLSEEYVSGCFRPPVAWATWRAVLLNAIDRAASAGGVIPTIVQEVLAKKFDSVGTAFFSTWAAALDARIEVRLPANSSRTKSAMFQHMYDSGWSVGEAAGYLLREGLATPKGQ